LPLHALYDKSLGDDLLLPVVVAIERVSYLFVKASGKNLTGVICLATICCL
jgi:hypothetical protein